jgi:putative redox protein
MIVAESLPERYQTRFSNGQDAGFSDTSLDKGGGGAGFRPHELLEAALASCMSMTLRMYAQRHAIALADFSVEVNLNRNEPGAAIFEYRLCMTQELDASVLAALHACLKRCPVSKTLAGALQLKQI